MKIETKLPKVGTTIFTVMSQLAASHDAVNLGQGFPDFDGPQALRDADMVVERDVEQLYDVEKETFLADRFVRGTCPNCSAKNQPGDNCGNCGETYTPADLIDPVSTLSGTTPEIRSAKHLFVQIEKLHGFLDGWTQSGTLPQESANYLKGYFLNEPLKDWDISRPGPYFGFEIPDSPGNYWYVWFDAPIGYIGT